MEETTPTVFSDVVIIGAGFSGINIACQLQRKLNFTDYVIYDRADEFGGTWSANKYPGCGVDIPAVFYSLSWFPNPNFTSAFPSQDEILEYLKKVAEGYRIPQKVRLQTEWKGAKWVEKISMWHVTMMDLKTGTTFVHEAKILVSAVGGYTNPKYPKLPGIERFQGPVVHTAKWDQEYDLKGRNVVVVGNGCSASQVIPAIINDAESVTQFIRSPQHYVPMGNFRITRLWRTLFHYVPFLLLLARWLIFWILETALTQFYDDESGRQAREAAVETSQSYIRQAAPERYWPLLKPEYDMGCKRRILDFKYITTLHDPKMQLVKETVESIQSNRVIGTSGTEYPAEFIILATGFEFTQWRGDAVIGRNGISMEQHWNQFGGIEAYKSVAMNDFPNLFYLLGPNSGRGHTSVLFSIECSTDLIIKVIKPILKKRVAVAEVRRDAEENWCDSIQGALRKTVLMGSCLNHFSDPKTGWNFFSYPFSSARFWVGTRFPMMGHWMYK